METKICKACNIAKDFQSYYKVPRGKNGLFAVCRSCHRDRDLKWKAENPEAVKEIQQRYQKANRVKLNLSRRKKTTENWDGYVHRRRELDAQRKLKRYDGLIEKLRIEQKDRCALCSIPFTKIDPIDIDHNHVTRLIRGLLCRKCNSGLHYFEDKEYTKKAMEYLLEPPAKKFPPIIY